MSKQKVMVDAGKRYLVISKSTGIVRGALRIAAKFGAKSTEATIEIDEGDMLVESATAAVVTGRSIFDVAGIGKADLDAVRSGMDDFSAGAKERGKAAIAAAKRAKADESEGEPVTKEIPADLLGKADGELPSAPAVDAPNPTT